MKNVLRALIAISVFFAILALASWAGAAEPTRGKVIPRAELPAAIQAPRTSKTAAKFPGVPSCRVGRLETDWGTVYDLTPGDAKPSEVWAKHACQGKDTVYVCAAFGTLSVRCQ
jgi:hypothetical protein